MKLNGIVGKGSGKLGASVFAISGGEQIVRQYNPQVSNPNTEAQIAQRAKLKLMSQLASVVAPALAFTKIGLVSARNQFVSKNIVNSYFDESGAAITLADLQLSNGSVTLPDVTATRGANNSFTVALAAAAASNIEGVVYASFKKNGNDKLEFIETKIANTPGAGRTFSTSVEGAAVNCVVYAYGIIAASNDAKISYENYMASAGEVAASLAVSKVLSINGVTTTATTGAEVAAAGA